MAIAEDRPSRGLHGAVFLIALSVLLLEVAITRVFAIVLWHHFAYMVISLALLGFGASGSLLTLFTTRGRTFTTRSIALCASGYGLAVVGAFLLITSLQIDSLEIWRQPSGLVGLGLCFIALALPFLLAGLALGSTFTRHPQHIGSLYAADLIGSALGAAIAPLLLEHCGSTGTVFAAAAIGGISGAVFAHAEAPRHGSQHWAIAGALVIAALGFSGGLGPIPALRWDVPFAPHKEVPRVFPGGHAEKTIHSATAQVDVSLPTRTYMSIGGQFGDRDWMFAEQRAVTQDGTAPTMLYAGASKIENFPALDDSQAASGYIAHRAAGRKDLDVLVIGCGGGVDVMTALYCGASHVTAVDVNSAMIQMVRDEYGPYIGHLFKDPRVELMNAEGRAFARSSGRLFDQIQMSGVDTYTALASGAYTLSESYLYTVEAVKDFVSHLKPNGIVTWSRFMMTYPKQARETIRLANIARTGLEELGIAEAWKHIVVLQAHGWASTMVKKSPWTPAELAALRQFSADQRFLGLVFDPERGKDGPFEGSRMQNILCERRAEDALRSTAKAIAGGATDNAVPEPWLKAVTHAFRAAADGESDVARARLEEFCTTLGPDVAPRALPYLLKARDEIHTFMQGEAQYFEAQQRDFATLIRGSAAERDAFVRDYFYDLSPSRDDSPYFFDYFRLSRFREAAARGGDWAAEYHPEFPVGHMVLLSSITLISILAIAFILLPLRRVNVGATVRGLRWRWFAWFGALGVGFMFIEIALMQKLTLFLGHPAHAISVVLTGMLAFSGIGAMLSGRIRHVSARTFSSVVLSILVLGFAAMLGLEQVLAQLLDLPFAVRVATALGIIAPFALLLGMPFPLGLRMLERTAPALVPWGWAVNGFLSVLSSMLATLIAMQTGFSLLLGLAALLYGLALCCVRGLLPARQA
jgi:SAM-dependent methyltransferase